MFLFIKIEKAKKQSISEKISFAASDKVTYAIRYLIFLLNLKSIKAALAAL